MTSSILETAVNRKTQDEIRDLNRVAYIFYHILSQKIREKQRS